MTIVEAAKVSEWVKRDKWSGYMLVSRRGEILKQSTVKWNELTYSDLIADDWQPYVYVETSEHDPSEDDATIRFRLMEME